MKIEAMVLDLWLNTSCPNVVSRPRPQGQSIFCDFIIQLDSSSNSKENEVLFVKIEARVLDWTYD